MGFRGQKYTSPWVHGKGCWVLGKLLVPVLARVIEPLNSDIRVLCVLKSVYSNIDDAATVDYSKGMLRQ